MTGSGKFSRRNSDNSLLFLFQASTMHEQNPTDYELCLKCQTGGDLVAKPEKASYVRFMECLNQWAKCKHPVYLKIQKRLEHITETELEEKGATWHSTCYKETVNKTNLEKAQKRYEASVTQGTASLVTSPRVGRPTGKTSQKPSYTSTSKHFTRSSSRASSKTELSVEREQKACCLFCDKDDTDADLHEVETFKLLKEVIMTCGR